jgi:hypothetical protein
MLLVLAEVPYFTAKLNPGHSASRWMIFSSKEQGGLRRTALFLSAQTFDKSGHLANTGVDLGLSFGNLLGRRAFLDGVLVGRYGNPKGS